MQSFFSSQRLAKSLLLFLLLTRAAQCVAWGKLGHQMVAQIAIQYLNPGVREKLERYLEEDMVSASTWMDEVRNEGDMQYLKHMHYINIARGEDYTPSAKHNVVNEIERIKTELRSLQGLDKAKVELDLKELIHLVGDIGQPLHCGYGEDAGGNKIKVLYQGKVTNLHHLWDAGILTARTHEVSTAIVALEKGITGEDKNTIWQSGLIAWVVMSRNQLPAVYAFENETIDLNYEKTAEKLIASDLLLSGLRLAGILNECFK